MNKRHHKPWSTKQVLGTNGRLACLECESDITQPRRRTFCSDKCYDSFRIRSSATAARIAVFKRDKGICALCNKDCFADDKWYKKHKRRSARGSGHLWQMDHILPVAEGGGSCDLSNLRSLCTSCHKIVTDALKKRLAEKRSLDKSE